MKHCLIVIDMQKGIFGLKRAVYQEKQLIQNIKTAIRFARENNIRVIFSLHENNTFLKQGTVGHQIIDDLDVLTSDTIIRKEHPDIFEGTNLLGILEEDHITSVMITGLISNGCVKSACQSALHNRLNVILIKDAHSTFYSNAEKIIEQINNELEKAGACVISSNELSTDLFLKNTNKTGEND